MKRWKLRAHFETTFGAASDELESVSVLLSSKRRLMKIENNSVQAGFYGGWYHMYACAMASTFHLSSIKVLTNRDILVFTESTLVLRTPRY